MKARVAHEYSELDKKHCYYCGDTHYMLAVDMILACLAQFTYAEVPLDEADYSHFT